MREQEELASEIEAWGGEVLIIPGAHRGEERVRPDPDLEAEWLGSLARMVQGTKPRCVLVTERVLQEKHPAPEEIRKGMIQLKTGDILDPLHLVESLVEAGYKKVGTIAERGGSGPKGRNCGCFRDPSDHPRADGMERGEDRVHSGN